MVLIEDISEIQFWKDTDHRTDGRRPHVIRFQTLREQHANHVDDQQRAVSISDLLRHALRQRPDRLIVGEIRGTEAFELLQALNSGHQGSMSTLHANSAEHAVTRFAHLLMAAGLGLPLAAARDAIVAVVDRVVFMARQNHRRNVTEILDLEGARFMITIRQAFTRALVCLALTAAAGCGGSPSSPSTSPSTPLAGVWRGAITLTPDGMSPVQFFSDWTLTETPGTSGLVYQADIRSQSTWFPALSTATVSSDQALANVQTLGFYTSPRGCQGSFLSTTRGTSRQLTGTFNGVDCGAIQFTGTVTLTR